MAAAVVGAALVPALPAAGQAYPSKAVRILTSAPGGSSDFVSRILADGLTRSLGQPVIVENRGGGVAIAEPVSKARADGYTLLIDGPTLWLPPLMQDMPYDPIRDFTPITLAGFSPNVLVVHPSLPARSVRELIAFARARPGDLSYGAAPPGSSTHLAVELFNTMAGVRTVLISYKGAGPAVIGLIRGEVQLMIPSAISVMGHVASGKLRALAVTTAEPTPLVPGVPTLASSGLPGYEAILRTGFFAPANLPADVLERLVQASVAVLTAPETRERLANAGAQAVGSSPAELGAAVRADMERWRKVIRSANIRLGERRPDARALRIASLAIPGTP